MHRKIFILLIFAISLPFGSWEAASSVSDNDPPLQLFNSTEDVIDSVESLELLSGEAAIPSNIALPSLSPVELLNAGASAVPSSFVFAERHFCRPPPQSFS